MVLSPLFCSFFTVIMESHSDRSSSLSADSGGLIDLYALDSDCKIGDSSQTSQGEARCIVVLL